jgi:hypothetical protein
MGTGHYPAQEAAHLAERLDAFPPTVRPRRWVLRDDNQQHYHGVVRLSEGPAYVELRWKPSAAGAEQLVGRYRLHLAELLAADYVRFEREGEPGDDVRLRFYRGAGEVVYVQARADRPGLAVGRVRA